MCIMGPLKIKFNQDLQLTTPLFLSYQKINCRYGVNCNTPYYVIERKKCKGVNCNKSIHLYEIPNIFS